MNALKTTWNDKKSLLILCFISTLYVLPIALADVPYLDDLGRNIYGYGWQHDGRFIATALGMLWSFGFEIHSIAPYSTFMSAWVLAFTGLLLTNILQIEQRKTIRWSALLLVISPFFLGNYIFQYDALPMALSLFVVVLPFVFIHQRYFFFIVSILSIWSCLGLYQNSVLAYFIIGGYFFISYGIKDEMKLVITKTLQMIFSFIIGFTAYLFCVNQIEVFTTHRTQNIFSEANFGELLLNNFRAYYDIILSLLHTANYHLVGGAFYIFALFGMFFYIWKNTKKNRLLWILISLIFILFSFIFIAGSSLLLKDNYWGTRIFTAYGCMMLIVFSFSAKTSAQLLKIGRILIICLLFYSMHLMAQTGRYLHYQYQFEKQIVHQIGQSVKYDYYKKIAFVSTLSKAPFVKQNTNKFSFLNYVFTEPLSEYSSWTIYFFRNFGYFDNTEVVPSHLIKDYGKLISETNNYKLYEPADNFLIIVFKYY